MTSKWIRSAPAAMTAVTSSPSRAKSAESRLGAIRMAGRVPDAPGVPGAPDFGFCISFPLVERLQRIARRLRAGHLREFVDAEPGRRLQPCAGLAAERLGRIAEARQDEAGAAEIAALGPEGRRDQGPEAVAER